MKKLVLAAVLLVGAGVATSRADVRISAGHHNDRHGMVLPVPRIVLPPPSAVFPPPVVVAPGYDSCRIDTHYVRNRHIDERHYAARRDHHNAPRHGNGHGRR